MSSTPTADKAAADPTGTGVVPVPAVGPVDSGQVEFPGADRSGGAGEILRPARARLLICAVLVVISTAAGLVPMIGVIELARTLLPALDGGPVNADRA